MKGIEWHIVYVDCVMRRDQDVDPDMIPQDMLKKYITYAKQNCRPQLQQADYERIEKVRMHDSCAALTTPKLRMLLALHVDYSDENTCTHMLVI